METIVCYQELKYISYKAFEGCSNIDLTLIGALSEKFVKSKSFFFRKIRTINFDENHSEVVLVDAITITDALTLPNVGWWLNSDGSMEEQENCTWG